MKKAVLKPCKTRTRRRKPAPKPIPLEELRMWVDTLTATAQAQVVDNSKTVFDREPVLIGMWSNEEIENIKEKIIFLHSWIETQKK